jgi:hypothetical protein
MLKLKKTPILLCLMAIVGLTAACADNSLNTLPTEKENEQASIIKSAAKDTLKQLPNQNDLLKQEGKVKIQAFAAQLKHELVSAIKQGGLSNGVEVCNSKAPQIAQALSVDGWTIKRTSLQTRNASNKANDWELGVLEKFETQLSSGTPISKLLAVESDDEHFNLMKAIETDQVCLACHGSSVDEKTLKTINALYPSDSATGFKLGDIRGAFSLQKDLSH